MTTNRYTHSGTIIPEVLRNSCERWKDKQLLDVTLPENRRCGRLVVELANAMMAAARSKKPPMVSKLEEEGELALVYWPSVGQEIAGLARYIKERSETKFLVLVPRRFIGYRSKTQLAMTLKPLFTKRFWKSRSFKNVLPLPALPQTQMIA